MVRDISLGKLGRAWSWFVAGLTEPPVTTTVDAPYLRRVVLFRWGLLVVYATSATLTGSILGVGWELATVGFILANNVSHTIHALVAIRTGALVRRFWWTAPFTDVAVISLIMATAPPMIFLAWGIAIMPMSFFTASMSWQGSYLWVVRAAAAAGFAGAVAAHAQSGLRIAAEDVAVAALLLTVGTWVTGRTAMDQRRLTVRLESQSLTDSLTGLMNRRALAQEISHPLIEAVSGSRSLAVLVADLDDFKRVNDDYGHEAGDVRLCRVAEIFRANLRQEDLVYRYGGDEFVVLAPVKEEGEASSLAQRLERAARREAKTRLSVGYALAPSGEPNLSDTLRRADRALLEAKRRGKGCVVPARELDTAIGTV
jgi:diguanylate cyclase (GGDEF)-like protein